LLRHAARAYASHGRRHANAKRRADRGGTAPPSGPSASPTGRGRGAVPAKSQEKGIRTPGELAPPPDFESIREVTTRCAASRAEETRHAPNRVETSPAHRGPACRARAGPPVSRPRGMWSAH
jgi:hypothetical protein